MFENFDECMNELVSIVNNARAIQQSVTDYGLTYVYRNLTSCFELVTGIRKEVEGTGRLEFLALGEQLDERQPSWRMRFEEEYDIVKYIFFVIYGIELGNIFERDISEVQNGKISFYEDEKINEMLKECISFIRSCPKIEKQYDSRKHVEEANWEQRIEESNALYDSFYTDEMMPMSIENKVYTGELARTNNAGRIWDNIISFKILDYGFKRFSAEKRKYPCYSLWVKFQIRSFIETENLHNFYDVLIPDFLVFPATDSTAEARSDLKNNLELLYSLNYEAVYAMLQKDFENFKHFRVGISRYESGVELPEFSEDVLSRLASYLNGLFYTGSKGIYTREDVSTFEKSFIEQNFTEKFMKNLFAEFLICCTGLKITDFNTVDSFYTMVEKISEKYEGDDSVEN
jgi:hypothetical protein